MTIIYALLLLWLAYAIVRLVTDVLNEMERVSTPEPKKPYRWQDFYICSYFLEDEWKISYWKNVYKYAHPSSDFAESGLLIQNLISAGGSAIVFEVETGRVLYFKTAMGALTYFKERVAEIRRLNLLKTQNMGLKKYDAPAEVA